MAAPTKKCKKFMDVNKDVLLSREDFKKLVFKKTISKCCVPGCPNDAVDAHHIMDRKLWTDGGYYLSNASSLCASCHLKAERGEFTPLHITEFMHINIDELRKPDKITELTHEEYIELFKAGKIDKWGK